MNIAEKADYVRSQMKHGAGGHHCHWPTCDAKVPPAMWGCKKHWAMLPYNLRGKIWVNFSPGQEIAKNPTTNYIETAYEVLDWIHEHYPETRPKPVRPPLEYDL
jgi:hypothetical protein